MKKKQKRTPARRGSGKSVQNPTLFTVCLNPETKLPGVGNIPVRVSADPQLTPYLQVEDLTEIATYCTNRGAPVFWSTIAPQSEQPVLYLRVPDFPHDSVLRALHDKVNFTGGSVRKVPDDFPADVLRQEVLHYLSVEV